MEAGWPFVRVEQFVMAYQVEQDRLRAFLPDGFESLRPVLRINAEIRTEHQRETIYLEFNTPVAAFGKRGWLNIAHWETPELSYEKHGTAVTFRSPFLEITYSGTGIEGGCPAEKDHDGCFFLEGETRFIPREKIDQKKEFCDCVFAWRFSDVSAHGTSIGEKTRPAFYEEPRITYEKQAFSAETAASIQCKQILGAYVVRFDR